MMRLLLVRHGETRANREGRSQGRSDGVLTRVGREQARRLGQALAREPLAAVYSSPLRRAAATARAIAGPRGLRVQVDARLAEMDVGQLDGLTGAEMQQRWPDFLRVWFSDDVASLSMPGGGESLQQVQDRLWAAAVDYRCRHQRQTIAAVTHNFALLMLLCRALELPIARFRALRHSVGAFTVLRFEDGGAVLERFAETCHLAGTASPPSGYWGRV